MDNIFTPEEENMPVTYGVLLQVLQSMQPAIESRDETLRYLEDVILTMSHLLVDAEYKRVRDMHFILSFLARERLYNKDKLYDSYIEWCKEYDKLNKRENNDGTNE